MSFTASRGVQCSPASSLFSSLKRRTSSSKIVPIAWLSRPECFTEPSAFVTGFGLRLIDGSRNFSIKVPSASAFDRRRDLIPELEVVEDFLDVRREAVEVRLEIGLELLLAGAAFEVAQGEFRGVVESLTGGLSKRRILIARSCLVSRAVFHVEDGFFGRLKDRVEPSEHHHRQDHVTVFAADIEIAEYVVGDAPDEVCNPAQIAVAHIPYALRGPLRH